MSIQTDIKTKWKRANVAEKLIVLNLLVYIIFNVFFYLMEWGQFMKPFLAMTSDFSIFMMKPWTILTYAMLHAGLSHLFFNMLMLYFASTIFLQFFSQKRLVNYYVMGAIFGGLFYITSYNIFPVLIKEQHGYLVGASAAVIAVLIGVISHAPHMKVRLLIFGEVKLWHIGIVFLVADILQLVGNNSGGHFAHLGGAFIGYFYTYQLKKGKDIGKWIENTISTIYRLFSYGPKEMKFNKIYRNQEVKTKTSNKKNNRNASKDIVTSSDNSSQQEKIDAILDKISQSGYNSLTKEEKAFLFSVGKK